MSHIDRGIARAGLPENPPLQRKHSANVGSAERATCSAVGGLLVLLGLRRGGLAGAGALVAGTALAWHGMKRHSYAYSALGIGEDDVSAGSHPFNRLARTRSTITINADPSTLYQTWRDVSRLADFFPHVRAVEEIGEGRTRWTACLPANQFLTWEAEITDEEKDRSIAWATTADAPFHHEGVIVFRDAPGGRGVQVTLDQQYRLPAGAIGALVAKLLRSDPQQEADTALRRFKQWVESGEIATAAGPAARNDGWNTHPPRRSPAPPRSAATERDEVEQRDIVEEASMASFPASDPPAFTTTTASGGEKRPGKEGRNS